MRQCPSQANRSLRDFRVLLWRIQQGLRSGTQLLLSLRSGTWERKRVPDIESAAIDLMGDGRIRFIVENLRDRLWLRPVDAFRGEGSR